MVPGYKQFVKKSPWDSQERYKPDCIDEACLTQGVDLKIVYTTEIF